MMIAALERPDTIRDMGVNRAEVKRRRLAKGWSFGVAAKEAGFYGPQRWYTIESGKRPDPAASTIQAMAKALGCTMEDLMEKPAGKRRGK